jgi:hypothetical protein
MAVRIQEYPNRLYPPQSDFFRYGHAAHGGSRRSDEREGIHGIFGTLNLVRKSPCSAYDCEFVALAEDLEIPLLTTDRKILSAFPSVAVSVGKFCS